MSPSRRVGQRGLSGGGRGIAIFAHGSSSFPFDVVPGPGVKLVDLPIVAQRNIDTVRMTEMRAQVVAQWRAPDDLWLDHTVLRAEDVSWLAPVRKLTMWAVKMPEGFLAGLTNLEWLDVRGGSGSSADFALECARLRYFAINQIRGVSDLSAVATLVSLELLSLYGLPRVTVLPSLSSLVRLARLELGSMKGLAGIGPALEAPALEELMLIRSVGLAGEDPQAIRDKPSIREFGWFAEDVPNRVWAPVRSTVGKPTARSVYPEDWFKGR